MEQVSLNKESHEHLNRVAQIEADRLVAELGDFDPTVEIAVGVWQVTQACGGYSSVINRYSARPTYYIKGTASKLIADLEALHAHPDTDSSLKRSATVAMRKVVEERDAQYARKVSAIQRDAREVTGKVEELIRLYNISVDLLAKVRSASFDFAPSSYTENINLMMNNEAIGYVKPTPFFENGVLGVVWSSYLDYSYTSPLFTLSGEYNQPVATISIPQVLLAKTIEAITTKCHEAIEANSTRLLQKIALLEEQYGVVLRLETQAVLVA